MPEVDDPTITTFYANMRVIYGAGRGSFLGTETRQTDGQIDHYVWCCFAGFLVGQRLIQKNSAVEIRRTCRTIGHFFKMSDKKRQCAGPNVRQKFSDRKKNIELGNW